MLDGFVVYSPRELNKDYLIVGPSFIRLSRLCSDRLDVSKKISFSYNTVTNDEIAVSPGPFGYSHNNKYPIITSPRLIKAVISTVGTGRFSFCYEKRGILVYKKTE